MKSSYLTPLTPDQRRDVDELIKYTEANRRPLRKPRIRKRDPRQAPRPVNCFLVYRKEKQAQIAELCTGANHRLISKIVAKWWKHIDSPTKEIYINVAKQVKQDHLKKFPDYKYAPKRKHKEPTTKKGLTLPCFETMSHDLNTVMQASPTFDNTQLTNLLLSQPVMDPLLDSYHEPSYCPPWITPTCNSLMMPPLEYLDPQWTDASLFSPLDWSTGFSATPISLPECDSPFSVWSDLYDLYPSLPLALS